MLSWSLKSDIGTREEQQDYALCHTENDFFAAVVCDGMGGLNGGSAAGKCAAEVLMQLIKKREADESIPGLFLHCVDIMDESVFHLKNESGESLNAGTTVVSVVIEKDKLYWLSVGDSRLYLMRGNELVRATRDHNYSLVLSSMPADYEPTAEDIAGKDALVSFVGMGGIEIMDISNNPVSLVKNDVILLTTDGLFKSLSDDRIKEVLLQGGSIEETAEMLMNQAKSAAPLSRDNTTFVIIKFKGE